MKRTKMLSLKINEISAVDRPAQEHARMVLMKRDGTQPVIKKETTMEFTAEQKAAQEAAITKAVETALAGETAKNAAALEVAKKFGEFNDAEKAHYNSLDEAGKKDFMTKSAEQRADVIKAEIAKAAEKDPVIYKSDAGIEYRKSVGEQVIALAKQNDENAKALAVEKGIREGEALQKRALETFPNMAGTPAIKAAYLKGIESIADEATRKSALEAAVAGDKALKAAFGKVGNSQHSAEAGSAQAEFDAGLKKYQEDNKVTSVAKATQAFLKTADGKALYQATQVKSN